MHIKLKPIFLQSLQQNIRAVVDMPRKPRRFVCDFETTVYDGQDRTDVWAAACVEIGSEDVHVFHSIEEQFDFFESIGGNIIAYYHNLKFDGEFWMYYLLHDLQYEQALYPIGEEFDNLKWYSRKEMPKNSFQYSISTMGQWYTMLIRTRHHYIELRDSLKLLPFSVRELGKSFGTKHKKLDMEYKGFRYPGCVITDQEREYIANDVLVVKEALEIMFDEGHDKLTIGSCCLQEFKDGFFKRDYEQLFPNLYEVPLHPDYGARNAGEYIRRSYHGGWCYLVPEKSCKLFHSGTTADVNSLYPSMMSSESGNVYPYGMPVFWKGPIPGDALGDNRYFFVRVRTRFYIKPGMLPTIQLKGNHMYPSREWLTSSDIVDPRDGTSYKFLEEDGELIPTSVVMTMTCTDFYQMLKHYDTPELEILDGCWFQAMPGLFDRYIDKYRTMKMTSKGARRTLAKLYLNNLYGKMAANTDSSFKVSRIGDDGCVHYFPVVEDDKNPGYIPVGSAITSYARNFTIRAAQANYHGPDAPGFIYADTDSIHCDLRPDEIVGVPVDPVKFCHWKLESSWDEGWFVRAKTYIEHVEAHDLEPCDPYYDVKCAGMPSRCKELFGMSMSQEYGSDGFTGEELEFLATRRGLEDFKVGLQVPGKLLPRRIPGGVLLCEVPFTMRG